MKKLKTAEQAVLTAVGQLGHGNVHQLAEAAGYARSTVDKAIKALAEAQMIVEYDTGADPAEGVPTQWQLAENDASAPIGTDADTAADEVADIDTDADEPVPDNDDTIGDIEPATDDQTEGVGLDGEGESGSEGSDSEDEFGNDHDDATGTDDFDDDEQDDGDDADGDAAPVRRPGNRRVMQIAGALVGYPDGATAEELSGDTGIPDPALNRLLAAMVSGGAAVVVATDDEDAPPRWKSGTTRAADIDPDPVIVRPRCEVCQRTFPADWTPPAADSEADRDRKAPDSKVLMLAGSMVSYQDGVSATQLVDDTRLTPQMVAQLLEAMQTAGVAERVTTGGADGQPSQRLWVLKPGPLNTVDPEPKCPGCRRPRPGVRSSSRNTPAGTRRPDALPRGVLREATLRFILARPGIVLSPGAIAAALTVELNRDAVSPGAVKDNCAYLAHEGKILEVSSAPWLFSTLADEAQDTVDAEDVQADEAAASTVGGEDQDGVA
ncbi:hypothetical protein Rhe02_09750 [Rhizocola hellebori]|uniref:Uncharacterized protein n=1 Tax=Rhizocola hellebori TaxID=1392758 RepID=A0A8J3VEC6_9ACTN|nr:hypothetical protein [Rhizocola hellebori]GIH02908.1 hypothetical protein Rhe02_09750 [Rhizocola hellebori]